MLMMNFLIDYYQVRIMERGGEGIGWMLPDLEKVTVMKAIMKDPTHGHIEMR